MHHNVLHLFSGSNISQTYYCRLSVLFRLLTGRSDLRGVEIFEWAARCRCAGQSQPAGQPSAQTTTQQKKRASRRVELHRRTESTHPPTHSAPPGRLHRNFGHSSLLSLETSRRSQLHRRSTSLLLQCRHELLRFWSTLHAGAGHARSAAALHHARAESSSADFTRRTLATPDGERQIRTSGQCMHETDSQRAQRRPAERCGTAPLCRIVGFACQRHATIAIDHRAW
jgi:hypothetical protein